MTCFKCGKGVAGNNALFRQNPKGELGIWACAEHNQKPIDPLVEEIVETISKENERNDS